MAGTTYSKWFWADWRSDPGLQLCSLAARGLWMGLLSIMAEADPRGHLLIAGNRPSMKQIAKSVAAPPEDVERLMKELERNGVYSRNRDGVIYSRRMVRDQQRETIARETGKKGGEASVRKRKGIFGPSKGAFGPTVHSPESIVQDKSPGPIGPAAPEQSKEPRAANVVPISNAYRTDLPETNTGLEPIHLKEILFTRALKWIERKAPERTVHRHRAWVGHLIKEFGELITIDAFRRAQQTAAVDPVSFIEGCCRHAKATGGVPGARREADPLAIAGIKQGG